MGKFRAIMAGICLLAAAGCSQAPTADNAGDQAQAPATTVPPSEPPLPAPPAQHARADWAGQWTGVEGLFVRITPTTPGRYNLEMADDIGSSGSVTFEGRDADGGIAFERDGQTLLLRKASGNETGLKYLEGEKNCLMVQEGEGFCR